MLLCWLMLLWVVGSCAHAIVKQESPVVELEGSVRPLLRRPFGTLVVLEVELVDLGPGKRIADSVLSVSSVDGVLIGGVVNIHWVYGGATARVRRQTALNDRVLELGSKCRVEGYEAGEFVGSPDGLASPDDGPLQLPSFQFKNCFHVTRVL